MPSSSLGYWCQKVVEVELHPTFANPFRVLKEPPFELEETGYASFTPKLIIYFNTPHAKPYPVQYDMNLKLEKHAFHQQEMTFAMSDVTPSFLELVRRFCGSTDGKRKKRDGEVSANRTKKPKPDEGKNHNDYSMKEGKESEKKKDPGRESEKSKKKTKRSSKDSGEGADREMVPARDASPESSPKDSSALRLTITPQRPVKVAPNKAEDRGQDSSSDSSSVYDSSPSSSSSVGASSPPSRRALPLPELHRRLTVAEILLTHPTSTTMLLPSKPSISFDLTSADAALVAKLSHVLVKNE
ncbi:YEATS family protein [Teladorsagia circumcincta]|uniref:YEATS family protein n=1 Tax=Teladorsagia circumcincta TaxID=45464 RepID=A0A2G9UNF3_TELCI|nr:YEATS family protein [Teladorsagia circumcincta]